MASKKMLAHVTKMDSRQFADFMAEGIREVIFKHPDRIKELWEDKPVDMDITANILAAALTVVEFGCYGLHHEDWNDELKVNKDD